jgi:ABC-type transporter Mla subunit MlaD
VATLPELARVPSDLVTLSLRAAAFPFAVLAELRRLNRTLSEVALLRTDVGPHLEHLPNLEALQGIRQSLDRLSQPGGALDRLADISQTLDRLAELDTSLKQLGALEESLNAIAAVAEAVAQLATVTDHLPQLVDATSALPELPDRVRSVEGLVADAVGNLDRLQPSLDRLGEQITELQGVIGGLGGALEPIGRLAGRVPGGTPRSR